MVRKILIIILSLIFFLLPQFLFAQSFALINGFLIDGNGGDPKKNAVIIIENNRITGIETGAAAVIPEKLTRIDLKGKTVLPGFFNAHVHRAYDEKKLKKWARAGVTTIRDLGIISNANLADRGRLLKDNQNARLIAAGPIVSTKYGYGSYFVNSAADAKVKVNKLIDTGVDFIKIGIEDQQGPRTWPLISLDEIKAIVDTAHERGLSVSSHVTKLKHVKLALQGNTDSIEHMIWDYLPDATIDAVVKRKIYWVPTLELWDGVSQKYGPAILKTVISNLDRFAAAGGKIALGTDYAGYPSKFELGMPLKEMRLMQQAGMTAMKIILSATRNGAEISGQLNSLGTIEKGKIADLIVVDGNPLDDLSVLGNVVTVIKNGEVIKE